LVGASGGIHSSRYIGNGPGCGQGVWVIRKLSIRNVGDLPGENNGFGSLIDDGQNASVQGDFHIVKETVEAGMVGPESNPDRVIVVSLVPHEERSQLAQKSGNGSRQTISDFLKFFSITIVIDIFRIIRFRGIGDYRIR
jgi:hypothetical protein